MTSSNAHYLRIHASDNAIVALQDLPKGQEITMDQAPTIVLRDAIPAKHKFASHDLDDGDAVTMYGVTVGKAAGRILQGNRITTENLRNAVDPAVVRSGVSASPTLPDVTHWVDTHFDGYHRPNGSVGTANVWLVVPMVFCENRNLALMKDALLRPLGLAHGTPYEQYVSGLEKPIAKVVKFATWKVIMAKRARRSPTGYSLMWTASGFCLTLKAAGARIAILRHCAGFWPGISRTRTWPAQRC